jgi:hypothetical protein
MTVDQWRAEHQQKVESILQELGYAD